MAKKPKRVQRNLAANPEGKREQMRRVAAILGEHHDAAVLILPGPVVEEGARGYDVMSVGDPFVAAGLIALFQGRGSE